MRLDRSTAKAMVSESLQGISLISNQLIAGSIMVNSRFHRRSGPCRADAIDTEFLPQLGFCLLYGHVAFFCVLRESLAHVAMFDIVGNIVSQFLPFEIPE